MFKRRLHFHSDAVKDGSGDSDAAPVSDDGLLVASFSGFEAVSKPFSFKIRLVSKSSNRITDFSALLKQDARLEISPAGSSSSGNYVIHGVLASFEQVGSGTDWIKYDAELVPPLWHLRLSRHTRIFMKKAIPDVIDEIFKSAKIPASTYDWRLLNRSSYPQQEYVVQYQESDFDFLSRLLEKEGIFYYFEHDAKSTKLIFGDHQNAFITLKPNKEVPLRAEAALSAGSAGGDQWDREEVISGVSARQQIVPTEVVLHDYNYRQPSSDLKVQAQVTSDAAIGTQYEYGHHYKDSGDGRRLAKVRAEEAGCQRVALHGNSYVKGLRSGCIYQIAKTSSPPSGPLSEEALVIQVMHQGSQALDHGKGSEGITAYSNSFTAIPQKIPFRPIRSAPRPTIAGSMNATVDSGTSGEYADIDKDGRYLVSLPFDLSDAADGKGSRYVRMAQPYGGKDMGMHFPLHKGTEVLLTHVGGDPDRPIISAAVPNPETPSVVHQDNHTHSVIKSGGNNEMRFEDEKGKEKIFFHAQKDAETRIEQSEQKTIGANQSVQVGGNHSVTIAGNRTESIGANHSETIGANQLVTVAIASSETIGAAKALTIGAAYQVTVGAAMNETVGAAKTEEIGAFRMETVAHDKTVTVGGNLSESTGGNHSETTKKNHTVKAKAITIEAEEEITLKVGDALISMKKNGDIIIKGKGITINGSGDVVIKGSKITQN